MGTLWDAEKTLLDLKKEEQDLKADIQAAKDAKKLVWQRNGFFSFSGKWVIPDPSDKSILGNMEKLESLPSRIQEARGQLMEYVAGTDSLREDIEENVKQLTKKATLGDKLNQLLDSNECTTEDLTEVGPELKNQLITAEVSTQIQPYNKGITELNAAVETLKAAKNRLQSAEEKLGPNEELLATNQNARHKLTEEIEEATHQKEVIQAGVRSTQEELEATQQVSKAALEKRDTAQSEHESAKQKTEASQQKIENIIKQQRENQDILKDLGALLAQHAIVPSNESFLNLQQENEALRNKIDAESNKGISDLFSHITGFKSSSMVNALKVTALAATTATLGAAATTLLPTLAALCMCFLVSITGHALKVQNKQWWLAPLHLLMKRQPPPLFQRQCSALLIETHQKQALQILPHRRPLR